MSIQLISDSTGETTGVFIPIKEWNKLKDKFKGIEQKNTDVPAWHMDVVRKRSKDYDDNPEQTMDFDTAMREIEKDL